MASSGWVVVVKAVVGWLGKAGQGGAGQGAGEQGDQVSPTWNHGAGASEVGGGRGGEAPGCLRAPQPGRPRWLPLGGHAQPLPEGMFSPSHSRSSLEKPAQTCLPHKAR